jgi:hypothetical protein
MMTLTRRETRREDGWTTVDAYACEVRKVADRIEHLFIVRMWREAGSTVTGWRGSAEHTGTKERIYFSSLVGLTEFLEARVAAPPPPEEPRES